MPLLNYTRKNIQIVNAVGTEPVYLMPGINDVSQKSLDAIKKHPAFQQFVEDGAIIIVQENKQSDGKMSINDMLNLIPKTYDTKLLKKIISEDGRDTVIQAAREQLDNIKNPKKNNEVTQGEHFK